MCFHEGFKRFLGQLSITSLSAQLQDNKIILPNNRLIARGIFRILNCHAMQRKENAMKKKNVFKPENPLDFVISNVSYRGKDLVEMIGLNPKVSYELKVLFMKATEVVLKMQKEYQACTLEQQRIDLINNVDWRLRMFCDYVFSEHPDRKTYFLDQMMECINTSYDHLENNPNGIEIETSLPEEN